MQAFTSSKVAHKQQTLTSKLTVSETEKHAFIHMCELKTPFEWTRWTVFSRAIWHGPLLDKWQNWQIRITIPLIATSLASPIRIYQAHSTVYMLYWMNVFDLKDTRNFSRCRLLPRIRSNVSLCYQRHCNKGDHSLRVHPLQSTDSYMKLIRNKIKL